MATRNEFKTAKEFNSFIEQNCPDLSKLYVKEVYNTGDGMFPEAPLFLYSGYSIIMAYLSKEGLSLKLYDKDFFIQHIRCGMFREEPDSDEIYYISFPKAKLIGSFVLEIETEENSEGILNGVVLNFENGQKLHLELSQKVPNTICSYITG